MNFTRMCYYHFYEYLDTAFTNANMTDMTLAIFNLEEKIQEYKNQFHENL